MFGARERYLDERCNCEAVWCGHTANRKMCTNPASSRYYIDMLGHVCGSCADVMLQHGMRTRDVTYRPLRTIERG
jgi:hypothetical protein